ncbi:hypothetical protein E4U42_005448 [Claviceps africana]|uniref:Uncharacterized protein n=1 Tax=Claviceps africana TaxID=83212 RepID=A0A8K0J3V9_9HYPO|nr:hypothetical protein E4U42_005448 [Claviceps africana]
MACPPDVAWDSDPVILGIVALPWAAMGRSQDRMLRVLLGDATVLPTSVGHPNSQLLNSQTAFCPPSPQRAGFLPCSNRRSLAPASMCLELLSLSSASGSRPNEAAAVAVPDKSAVHPSRNSPKIDDGIKLWVAGKPAKDLAGLESAKLGKRTKESCSLLSAPLMTIG